MLAPPVLAAPPVNVVPSAPVLAAPPENVVPPAPVLAAPPVVVPTAPVPAPPANVPAPPVRTAPPIPAPRPRPVVAAPAAPLPGTISIIASVPSSVTIDGAHVGQTPLELPSAAGQHVVVVTNDAFHFTERYELSVFADRNTPLMVTVTPPPPDHYVVKGRLDSKTYEFDALSREELKATCLQWLATHFPRKGPRKMTANGGEWPEETSPMPASAVCGYVVKNADKVAGKR